MSSIIFDHADRWDRIDQNQQRLFAQEAERKKMELAERSTALNERVADAKIGMGQARLGMDQTRLGMDQTRLGMQQDAIGRAQNEEMAERAFIRQELVDTYGMDDSELENILRMPIDALRDYHNRARYDHQLQSLRDGIDAMIGSLFEDDLGPESDPNDPMAQQAAQQAQALRQAAAQVNTIEEAQGFLDNIVKQVEDQETAIARAQERQSRIEQVAMTLQALQQSGMGLNASQRGRMQVLFKMYGMGMMDGKNDETGFAQGDSRFAADMLRIMAGGQESGSLVGSFDHAFARYAAQMALWGVPVDQILDRARLAREGIVQYDKHRGTGLPGSRGDITPEMLQSAAQDGALPGQAAQDGALPGQAAQDGTISFKHKGKDFTYTPVNPENQRDKRVLADAASKVRRSEQPEEAAVEKASRIVARAAGIPARESQILPPELDAELERVVALILGFADEPPAAEYPHHNPEYPRQGMD